MTSHFCSGRPTCCRYMIKFASESAGSAWFVIYALVLGFRHLPAVWLAILLRLLKLPQIFSTWDWRIPSRVPRGSRIAQLPTKVAQKYHKLRDCTICRGQNMASGAVQLNSRGSMDTIVHLDAVCSDDIGSNGLWAFVSLVFSSPTETEAEDPQSNWMRPGFRPKWITGSSFIAHSEP